MAIVTACERAREISKLTREEVVQRLLNFDGRAPLDFTREFLARQSTDHLKHILLAAHQHLG